MTRLNKRGLSIIEAIVALAIIGIILAILIPSFVGNLRINNRTELRGVAIGLAQQRLEELRAQLPVPLPTTESSSSSSVAVQGRTFAVQTTYCPSDVPLTSPPTATCTATRVLVRVQVSYLGSVLYAAETVYTSFD